MSTCLERSGRSQSVATRLALAGAIDPRVLDMLCDEVRAGSGRASLVFVWRMLPALVKGMETRIPDGSGLTRDKVMCSVGFNPPPAAAIELKSMINCVIPLMYKGEPAHVMQECTRLPGLRSTTPYCNWHTDWFLLYEVSAFVSVAVVAIPGLLVKFHCESSALADVLRTIQNCLAVLSPSVSSDNGRFVVDVQRYEDCVCVTVDQAGAVSRITMNDGSARRSACGEKEVDRLYVVYHDNGVGMEGICMDEPAFEQPGLASIH
jgi:hypothetical protein